MTNMKITKRFKEEKWCMVNFEDEGMPWTKVFGKYKVLYFFKDASYDDGPMVALENPENKNRPIFVTKKSIILLD